MTEIREYVLFGHLPVVNSGKEGTKMMELSIRELARDKGLPLRKLRIERCPSADTEHWRTYGAYIAD